MSKGGARLRLSAVLLVALLLQTTVVPDLRILGVCPDLLLLCTVAAALVGGPELGGEVGFVAGVLADLFLATTPLGLSALTYTVIGYGVGSIRRTTLQEGWLLAPATAFVASAAGVVLFVIAGVTVGQSQLTRRGPVVILETATLVGVMNAILAAPVCRLVGWAMRGMGGRRRRAAGGGEVPASNAWRSAQRASGRAAAAGGFRARGFGGSGFGRSGFGSSGAGGAGGGDWGP